MMNDGMYSSVDHDWETPQWLFNDLNRIFKFDIDVCANESNHKCSNWFGSYSDERGSYEVDGLTQNWSNRKCWMNPPYGRDISKWVAKANNETASGSNTIVVGLLPARTDTRWFHSYCTSAMTVGFIRGRLKFSTYQRKPAPAPFPSMIVVWGLENQPLNVIEYTLRELGRLSYVFWMESNIACDMLCIDEKR